MTEIKVGENESLDNALKRFKRSCARSGVIGEVRKREHYEKPSVRKKKKSRNCKNLLHVSLLMLLNPNKLHHVRNNLKKLHWMTLSHHQESTHLSNLKWNVN